MHDPIFKNNTSFCTTVYNLQNGSESETNMSVELEDTSLYVR